MRLLAVLLALTVAATAITCAAAFEETIVSVFDRDRLRDDAYLTMILVYGDSPESSDAAAAWTAIAARFPSVRMTKVFAPSAAYEGTWARAYCESPLPALMAYDAVGQQRPRLLTTGFASDAAWVDAIRREAEALPLSATWGRVLKRGAQEPHEADPESVDEL